MAPAGSDRLQCCCHTTQLLNGKRDWVFVNGFWKCFCECRTNKSDSHEVWGNIKAGRLPHERVLRHKILHNIVRMQRVEELKQAGEAQLHQLERMNDLHAAIQQSQASLIARLDRATKLHANLQSRWGPDIYPANKARSTNPPYQK